MISARTDLRHLDAGPVGNVVTSRLKFVVAADGAPYVAGVVVTEDDDQGWREFREPVAPTESRPAEGVSDSAALVARFLGPPDRL
jgi:hypothetical protein